MKELPGKWTFDDHDIDRIFSIAASMVRENSAMAPATLHAAAKRYVAFMAELEAGSRIEGAHSTTIFAPTDDAGVLSFEVGPPVPKPPPRTLRF